MRTPVFLVLLLVITTSCGQEKKYHDEQEKRTSNHKKIAEVLKFQEELNAEYRNPEKSPLPDRYRKKFKGLDFFEPDTNYIVIARFERTPDAKPFFLPTTTSRKTEEVLYGIAYFELNGKKHQLEIYQTISLREKKGFEDYLFLPFLDETNGEETYGGGRYIDLTIPKRDTIVIDFNKAYNPYCVYNKKYSCPLVPRKNYLRTKVKAGVKDFNKEN